MSDAAFVACLCAVVGLVIGSFLNVVVWRVPRDESIVSPPSACPSCGTTIAARDNIPVLSWLLLRGRCRSCSAPISKRYPLVELGTSALFALMGYWAFSSPDASPWALPTYLYFAAISVALLLIDLDVKRLPNVIVLPSYVVLGVLLTAASAMEQDWEALVRAAIGMAALWGLYFILVVIYPAGMGFGDVKLAGVLGMLLAWHSWAALIVGGFLGFFLGGVWTLPLLLLRRVGRKTGIPFGPFMLAGAFLALFYGQAIADWYLRLSGLEV